MEEHPAMLKRPMSVAETARYLGVSEKTVKNMMARGLPHHRLSNKLLRFYPEEVDEWIRANPNEKK